jgi:hypothetical protein
MTAPRARALLVHSIQGRARLRFPEQRGQQEFFSSIANALTKLGAVLEVRASPDTGSVLVVHTGDFSAILAAAQKRGLFEVATPPPPLASLRQLRNVIDSVDDRVAKQTGDTFSVGKLVFMGLLGAGIFQAKNGHLLPAGLTLFKHALEIMDWAAEREPLNSR